MNGAAQTVNWSVSGNKSGSTKISSTGLLTVAADETASVLTVKAESAVDQTKSGEAAVTITKAEKPENPVPKKNSVHKAGKLNYKVTKSNAKSGGSKGSCEKNRDVYHNSIVCKN